MGLPAEAIDDAFQKLTRPEGPTLEARNRAVRGVLMDWVTLEYRPPNGSVPRGQIRAVDFAAPKNNDRLAVNHFAVVETGTRAGSELV